MFKKILWNLVGAGIPLGAGIYSIPLLVSGYGDERFGLLTVIWVVIGYFSIFDFGIARTLTKFISDHLERREQNKIKELVKTALATVVSIGLAIGLIMLVSADWIIDNLFKIGNELHEDGYYSLVVMSLSIPLVVVSAILVGILEAYSRFKEINLVKIVVGAANFLGPVIVLFFSEYLFHSAILLVVLRLLTCLLYCYYVYLLVFFDGGFCQTRFFYRDHFVRLIRFGGWVTVSNLISPIMVQLDKVIMLAWVPISQLKFYSIPADIINRLNFVQLAVVGVVFPVCSRMNAAGNNALGALYVLSSGLMICLLTPPSLIIFMFSEELFTIWLGNEFSNESSVVIKIMIFGYIVNGFARIPHAFLQAFGRPDLTAKIHLVELPLYILILAVMAINNGIVGAAIAWSTRMAIDAAAMLYFSGYVQQELKGAYFKVVKPLLFGSCLLFVAIFIDVLFMKISYILLVSSLCIVYLYYIFNMLKKIKASGDYDYI